MLEVCHMSFTRDVSLMLHDGIFCCYHTLVQTDAGVMHVKANVLKASSNRVITAISCISYVTETNELANCLE